MVVARAEHWVAHSVSKTVGKMVALMGDSMVGHWDCWTAGLMVVS